MNNFNKFILITIGSFAVGCASTGTKTSNKSEAQSQTKIASALPANLYISTRTSESPKPQFCPANNGWKKESLTRLMSYANSCVVAKNAVRTEALGDWIAQKSPYSPWGAYFLSLSAQLNKNYHRSLWMIDLAIKKSPSTAMLHYQKGRILWEMADYPSAVTAFKNSLQFNAQFADAHLFLAQLYFKEQNFKQSQYHFAQVVKIEPTNSEAFAGLAETQILQGDFSLAVENYALAVNLNPRQINYRIKLASLYENNKKDLASALLTYKRLHSYMTESKANFKELPFDLNEKIKKLEALVSERDVAGKKVTASDTTTVKKR